MHTDSQIKIFKTSIPPSSSPREDGKPPHNANRAKDQTAFGFMLPNLGKLFNDPLGFLYKRRGYQVSQVALWEMYNTIRSTE